MGNKKEDFEAILIQPGSQEIKYPLKSS